MWFSTPQTEAMRSWGPGLFLQLRNCGGIEEITKQAGTFKDFYCSLKRHTGLPAKSLLSLADKNKGKVRPKSSWNYTEKYNPHLLEFLMQKSPVSPQGVRKGERNWCSNGILQGIEPDPVSFSTSPGLPKALTTFQPQAGLYFIKWNVSISPSPPGLYPAECCVRLSPFLSLLPRETLHEATPRGQHRNHCDVYFIWSFVHCLVHKGFKAGFSNNNNK